jgi:transposase
MTKRSYDKEFKLNAISLYKDKNKKLSEVCRELGIPEATFSGWIKKYNIWKEESFSESKKISVSEKEFQEMKKRATDAELERDILKKALAIFSRQK